MRQWPVIEWLSGSLLTAHAFEKGSRVKGHKEEVLSWTHYRQFLKVERADAHQSRMDEGVAGGTCRIMERKEADMVRHRWTMACRKWFRYGAL